MTVSLVFNELSLRISAPDKHTARKWMTEFVGTLKAAVDHKVTVLRMRENFGDIILSPDYPLHAWFHDNRVPKDERDFVLIYSTQYSFIRPYDEDLRDNSEFQSDRNLFEGNFKGEKAEGLGFAHLLNGLALSILSEHCWDTPLLDLDCNELDPESGEISEHRETLLHVSRSRHVSEDHAAWIEKRIRSDVRAGSDLLRNAVALFPNLVFCSGASRQIEKLAASSMHLPRILERLLELEGLANSWIKNSFNYRLLHNSSPESESTISKYGELRRFLCPDGQRRTFDWHLKGLPQKWRIHIWADPGQKKILIGYVGRHLPTSTDPT